MGKYLPRQEVGPTTWFLKGTELIEIRMNNGLIATAHNAAITLDARFFFRREDSEWQVYDREYPRSSFDAIGYIKPIKSFLTEDISPAMMWALAQQAGEG